LFSSQAGTPQSMLLKEAPLPQDMYQDYIDGKKELREINMEFNARYIKDNDMPGKSGCNLDR
jgi:hypothetical protein